MRLLAVFAYHSTFGKFLYKGSKEVLASAVSDRGDSVTSWDNTIHGDRVRLSRIILEYNGVILWDESYTNIICGYWIMESCINI